MSLTTLLGAPIAFAQSGQPVAQGAPEVPGFEPAFSEQSRAPASGDRCDKSAKRLSPAAKIHYMR